MGNFSTPSATLAGEHSQKSVLARLASSKLLVAMGLTLYVVSFLLWAVGGNPVWLPLRGYDCASLALFSPWSKDGQGLRHESALAYISLVISGWINPLFLAAAILGFWRATAKVARVFGVLTLVSVPFCWVVFVYEHFYPREGHILWVTGMVLTLAAAWLTKRADIQTRVQNS